MTVTNTAVKKTATSSNGTVSFDGLQAGAYLVLVTDSSNKTTYSTMVAKTYKYDDNQLIAPLDETVVAKAETYHTDKDVDKATAEVGELVTYPVKTVGCKQTGGQRSSRDKREHTIHDLHQKIAPWF